jgi:hypothetical protein
MDQAEFDRQMMEIRRDIGVLLWEIDRCVPEGTLYIGPAAGDKPGLRSCSINGGDEAFWHIWKATNEVLMRLDLLEKSIHGKDCEPYYSRFFRPRDGR